MKKIITSIFCLILLNLLVLLTINYNIKYVMSDLFSNSGIHNKINNAISICFNKKNMNIVDKNEISDIIDEFLEALISDGDDETDDVLAIIINKKRNKIKMYGIDDNEIDNVIFELEASINSNNSFNDRLSDKQKVGLVIYKLLSTVNLRRFLIFGIILCCLFLLIINRLNSLIDIGISFLGTSFLIKGSCIIINYYIKEGTFKDILNGIHIKLNSFDKFVYGYGVLGMLLIMGYTIYKLTNRSKKP
ncbi:MAG: hypothetical protein IKF19_00055 [Bacilli bacterium]|nr:hypothetical protein [Bacilli bacterium]